MTACRREAVRLDELAGGERAEPFDRPAEVGERRALRHERVGNDRREVGVLGGLENPVCDLDRPAVVVAQEVRPRKLAAESDARGVGGLIGELIGGRFEEGERLSGPPRTEEGPAEGGGGSRRRRSVSELALGRDRLAEVALGCLVAPGCRGGLAGALEELGSLVRVGGHGQSLVEEGEGLVGRAEGAGPLRSRSQSDARLGGNAIGLRSVGAVPVGREVVPREGSRELVGPEALEEAGGGEMAGLAVAPRERVVGDLANERLDESVLAALRRAGVGLEGKELAPDEGAEARFELDPVDSRYRCEPGEGEGLAEDGGIAEEGSVVR